MKDLNALGEKFAEKPKKPSKRARKGKKTVKTTKKVAIKPKKVTRLKKRDIIKRERFIELLKTIKEPTLMSVIVRKAGYNPHLTKKTAKSLSKTCFKHGFILKKAKCAVLWPKKKASK